MIKRLLLVMFCLLLLPCYSYANDKPDLIFQVSTINALLEGVYDSNYTFANLKRKGNLGLGTLNAIDGEMIALNGKFYQVKTDGKVYEVPDNAETPFAVVTFFKSDINVPVKKSLDYSQLKTYLDSKLPTTNLFYAFKIRGTFEYMKVRSVPKQKKPYPPLAEVAKEQAVFELHNVKGTIIGFRCPEYAKEINVAGYHFHFLTDDKKAGGHVLDLTTGYADAEIDSISSFYVTLPESDDFYKVNLEGNREKELHKIEN